MRCHHHASAKAVSAVYEKVSSIHVDAFSVLLVIVIITSCLYNLLKVYYFYTVIKTFRNTNFRTMKLKTIQTESDFPEDKENILDEKKSTLKTELSTQNFKLTDMTFSNKLSFSSRVAEYKFFQVIRKVFSSIPDRPYDVVCYNSPECQGQCKHRFIFVGEQDDEETKESKEDTEDWYHC
ncbi:hypothetical protein NADFUDRAFT_44675 [Nadsonia fulvescens var. elongata DSM 6958]|uniref:Uncharacterized protein n=1 Tax=Nadsonia fulvescens var. elongata DSM 6958 TaxID=857566 RepID=A0A1E3PRN1_9ASCO|nr:hypothetical protein NADFUDRAFT_44675 [Nadsonia fulvescens var. elongata DSM 6958]